MIRACMVLVLLWPLLLALPPPASAAPGMPLAPAGSRVALVPPAGFVPSQRFAGFEAEASGAGIVIAELPAGAYAELTVPDMAARLAGQGLLDARSEPFPTMLGAGTLISGRQERAGRWVRKWLLLAPLAGSTLLVTVEAPLTATGEGLDEVEVRSALASLRPSGLTDEAAVAALPFTFAAPDSLPLRRTFPGATALFGPGGDGLGAPFLIVAPVLGQPAPGEPVDQLARRMLRATARLEGVTVDRVSNRPILGTTGVEIMAHALDDRTQAPVALVQWVAYLPQGYVRILGVSPADEFPRIFGDFRRLAESIRLR